MTRELIYVDRAEDAALRARVAELEGQLRDLAAAQPAAIPLLDRTKLYAAAKASPADHPFLHDEHDEHDEPAAAGHGGEDAFPPDAIHPQFMKPTEADIQDGIARLPELKQIAAECLAKEQEAERYQKRSATGGCKWMVTDFVEMRNLASTWTEPDCDLIVTCLNGDSPVHRELQAIKERLAAVEAALTKEETMKWWKRRGQWFGGTPLSCTQDFAAALRDKLKGN